jgi:two-component system sensor histidine kinase RstB
MIRFFVQVIIVFLCVVLSIKWTVEAILFREVYSDRNRVTAGLSQVHLDQLHFLADQLVACPPQEQGNKLAEFGKQSVGPLAILPIAELAESEQSRLKKANGFIVRYADGMIDYLGVPISEDNYLLCGPIGRLSNRFIELQVDGWLKGVREALESSGDVQATLSRYSSLSRVPIRLEQRESLPDKVSEKLTDYHESVFYQTDVGSFVALELRDSSQVLCLGPLLEVTNYAQVAAGYGILGWLLVAFAVLAWMIIKVSLRFRKIENAAVEIADGNFSARVDATKLGEATKLAVAFNTMASKTESVIRTQKELLQVVSHELRTPLSRLKFAAALVPRSQIDQGLDSPGLVMLQSIDDIEAIVQEILFYVRNEQAEPLQSKEIITINLALEGILRALRIDYPQLQVEMVFAGSDPGIKVLADRRSFQRVFVNLTSNGARYAKSLLRLRVSEVQESVSGAGELSYICIDVEDDGPGIPEAMRSEVMKPFVRIDPGSKDKEHASSHSGLGLGLAIVNRILQQHGGSVQIDRGELGGCLVKTRWPNT